MVVQDWCVLIQLQSGGPDFGRGKCGNGKTARELTLSARSKSGLKRHHQKEHVASVGSQEIKRNRHYHREAFYLGIGTITITKLPYGPQGIPQGMERVLSYEITKYDIL